MPIITCIACGDITAVSYSGVEKYPLCERCSEGFDMLDADDAESDDDALCGYCDGTGEGFCDGSTCQHCKGSGLAHKCHKSSFIETSKLFFDVTC